MNDVQKKLVEQIANALVDPACPYPTGVGRMTYYEALDVARFIVMGDES